MQFRRDKKAGPTVSLQETLDAGKEDSALTLSDLLQDAACMEENCEKKEEASRLRSLIETLPARERQLVLLRYGLAGQPPLTQLETARLLGISRSYVSRLETHALDLLRQRWAGYRHASPLWRQQKSRPLPGAGLRFALIPPSHS